MAVDVLPCRPVMVSINFIRVRVKNTHNTNIEVHFKEKLFVEFYGTIIVTVSVDIRSNLSKEFVLLELQAKKVDDFENQH